MTRHRGARAGMVAAAGPIRPSQWAEWALCTQADPDAWFRPKASTPWPKPPRGSAVPARSAGGAWTTHYLAPTPGVESRPGSGRHHPQQRNQLRPLRKTVAA
jgi:hypothetical protein